MHYAATFLRKLFSVIAAFALVLLILTGCSDDADEIVPPQKNTLDAVAGLDQNVLINTEILLDGSASNDANGTPFDYKWVLKYKPSGSSAGIVNPTSAQAGFTPDKSGIYDIMLTISSDRFTDTDEIRVIATKTDDPNEAQTIFIDSDITQERMLHDVFAEPGRPDYIVTKDLRVSALVTIQPGVIIEFEQDKGMQIMLGGALQAEGTATLPITFTGTEKETGYWKGLSFATNNSLNHLSYVTVEFGGSSEFPESPRANISVPGDAISGSVVRIANSIIKNSGDIGIYVGGMSMLSEFSNMTVTDNTGTAVYASPRNISRIDPNTSFSDNGFNGIETGGMFNEGILTSWRPLASGSYKITSDLTIASALEIVPGANFKMAKNVLITIAAGAQLSANGTPDEKIVFEGISTISDNAWRGIVFVSGQENSIDYAVIRNAGNTPLPGIQSDRAIIGVVPGGKLAITNSLIEKCTGWGIVLEQGAMFNEDIHTGNTYVSTTLGSVKFPTRPQSVDIAGEWVEYSGLISNQTIDKNFYNRATDKWFGGADNPWTMTPQTAFGLSIDPSGNYVWIMAVMHSPMTECFTYSAEHFTGTVTADGDFLNFVEESWRSKYFNSCAPDESKDFDVDPGQMQLPYEITKEFNAATGKEYTVLNITSGGETFKLYKK